MDAYDMVLMLEERVYFLREMVAFATRRHRHFRRRVGACRRCLRDFPGGGESSFAIRHELSSYLRLKSYWKEQVAHFRRAKAAAKEELRVMSNADYV